MEYPQDPATFAIDDEFLIGKAEIKVAFIDHNNYRTSAEQYINITILFFIWIQ